jgi:hypothetical protein
MSMSDLLSASSLLMAIAAILFGLWYSEIARVLNVKPNQYVEDNAESKRIVTTVFFTKAVPVAFMAFVVALIFLPDAFMLVGGSYRAYTQNAYVAIKYDAVATAFCFVNLISIWLSLYMFVLLCQLWSLRKRLS